MPKHTGLSPNDLVQECLCPFASPEELEQLGERAAQVIRWTLLKSHLAQPENVADVLQEALLTVLTKCYAPDGKPLRNVPGYLLVVARHAAHRLVRKEVARQRLLRLSEAVHGGIVLPQELSLDERLLVKDSLHKLTRTQRRILTLTYVFGLSAREVEAQMGYRREGTVRVAQFRAVRALARIMQGTLADAPPGQEDPCD